jgi:HAMP domain-containing protein
MKTKSYIIRKRYLINKGFQLRFMVVITLAMILIALVASISIYSAVMQTLVTQFHGENLALIKHAINAKLIMRSLLLIFAIAVISIFISHRAAGPVYKFESVIKALARGDGAKEIWLRKRDEFYDLAEAINSLIKSMKR